MLGPVVLASKHKFGKASNLILDHMKSQVSCDKDNLNISDITLDAEPFVNPISGNLFPNIDI